MANQDEWIFTQIVGAVIVSVAGRQKQDFNRIKFFLIGYIATIHMIPLVAEKLVPKLYGIDIGKRGLGGPHDGEKVPER